MPKKSQINEYSDMFSLHMGKDTKSFTTVKKDLELKDAPHDNYKASFWHTP
jgi:hypothetical protein